MNLAGFVTFWGTSIWFFTVFQYIKYPKCEVLKNYRRIFIRLQMYCVHFVTSNMWTLYTIFFFLLKSDLLHYCCYNEYHVYSIWQGTPVGLVLLNKQGDCSVNNNKLLDLHSICLYNRLLQNYFPEKLHSRPNLTLHMLVDLVMTLLINDHTMEAS